MGDCSGSSIVQLHALIRQFLGNRSFQTPLLRRKEAKYVNQ